MSKPETDGIWVSIEEYHRLGEENASLRRVMEMSPQPPGLRDYFAAAAMGAIAQHNLRTMPLPDVSSEVIAAQAYIIADAMLKARME